MNAHTSPILIWFRQDLRLGDHPALHEAHQTQRPIIPVYIWSEGEEQPWSRGGASRWWLWKSLQSLDKDLRRIGSRLILRQGRALPELENLIRETDADTVYWNRRYEPHLVQRDTALKDHLAQAGITAKSFNGSLLVEPTGLKNKSGNPYQVFTPFYRAFSQAIHPPAPLPGPQSLTAPGRWPESIAVSDLPLQPSPDWAAGLEERFTPGESSAVDQLCRFVEEDAADYLDRRDLPGESGTSRLSPHLHFGELSPRLAWQTIQDQLDMEPGHSSGGEGFARQLVWREFAHHILFHFPHTPELPLRPEYADFPWQRNPVYLKAWQQGQTGYPIVDAGMRELWVTGWMHNRVRMVVASFLVKHLLQPWQDGAAWFWDTLVDADLANNTMGWQWAAGCGADAAPYFRIFNPMTQGKKFDKAGTYVRRWVPELAGLPDTVLHEPWLASEQTLQQAHVVLGQTYPAPIVDHHEARQGALQALADMKEIKELT